jgi:hypothetical protein
MPPMENKAKISDALPDSFATEEEAGEFWDMHSAADYIEFFEAADRLADLDEPITEAEIAAETTATRKEKT